MWATGTLGALVDGVRIGPLGACAGAAGLAVRRLEGEAGVRFGAWSRTWSGSSSAADERVKGPNSTPGGVKNGGREGDDRDFCPPRASESAAGALRFIK